MNVTPRTLEDLGFIEVQKALAARCRMEAGARRAMERPFLPDRDAVLRSLNFVQEARRLRQLGRTLPLGGLRDVRGEVERAAKGAMLEPRELIATSHVLGSMGRAKDILEELSTELPEMAIRGRHLPDLPALLQRLGIAIEPSGEISDRASPELADARARARGLHRTIKTRLDKYLHDEKFLINLREAYYSIRNDRYVVPVHASHRNEVPGIVHNASQSGQTLFVEPEGLIGLGNDLAIAQSLVLEEERQILIELSSQIGHHAPQILAGLDALAELDEVEAAAHLAEELDATSPLVESEDGAIELRELRHPRLMLRTRDVVSNDVVLRDDARALVVSGPNAGGKTVTLTAVGLCALMLRSGLPIPAGPGSKMPLYRSIHSTVGDAQDLTQDLSTFSAHVAELRKIIESAGRGSLVLIDEIAADTNPREGAALAVAVLEALIEQRAIILVTTHLEELKALAFLDPRFVNARVGFDSKKMAPTYKLQMGVAGSSSAIEVAERMGLPLALCERARVLVQGSGGPLNQALQSVETQQRQLATELERARTEALNAQRLREEAERLRAQVEQRRTDEEIGFREALQRELEQARIQIRTLVDQLTQRKDLQLAEQARKELTARIEEQEQAARVAKAAQERAQHPELPLDLRVGGWVRHVGLNSDVEILEIEGDEALVSAGILKTRVRIQELVPAKVKRKSTFPAGGEKQQKTLSRAEAAAPASWTTTDPRCDVRGLRTDDAIREVDQFLDRRFRAEEKGAVILHGHGTGTLKQLIRAHLDGSAYVKDHRAGTAQEGGDAVTVVTFADEP